MTKRKPLTGRKLANKLLADQADKIIGLRAISSQTKGGWAGTSVQYHIGQACHEIAVKARWDAMSMWEMMEGKGLL